MANAHIIEAIDSIISDLSCPTTLEEQREGWDDALKRRWCGWFESLKAIIETGGQTPAGWGIVRAMDFDAIDPMQSSRLTRQASQIGLLLDE